MFDIQGFNVIHDGLVYPGVHANPCFDFIQPEPNTLHHPDRLEVWVLDSNNRLMLLIDDASRFQFVRNVEDRKR